MTVKTLLIEYDDADGDVMGGYPLHAPAVEVVRCRDCAHMHVVQNWLGMDVNECWLHASPETGALGKERTEPAGFCAWGERRAVP